MECSLSFRIAGSLDYLFQIPKGFGLTFASKSSFCNRVNLIWAQLNPSALCEGPLDAGAVVDDQSPLRITLGLFLEFHS